MCLSHIAVDPWPALLPFFGKISKVIQKWSKSEPKVIRKWSESDPKLIRKYVFFEIRTWKTWNEQNHFTRPFPIRTNFVNDTKWVQDNRPVINVFSASMWLWPTVNNMSLNKKRSRTNLCTIQVCMMREDRNGHEYSGNSWESVKSSMGEFSLAQTFNFLFSYMFIYNFISFRMPFNANTLRISISAIIEMFCAHFFDYNTFIGYNMRKYMTVISSEVALRLRLTVFDLFFVFLIRIEYYRETVLIGLSLIKYAYLFI